MRAGGLGHLIPIHEGSRNRIGQPREERIEATGTSPTGQSRSDSLYL